MTDHRCCLLIPHYCHDRELAAYLPKLETAGLPAVVVDDGSDPATRARLRCIVSGHRWSSLIQRDSNGGKGAAVVCGLRALAREGYTHAISVDADGQHDAADVARICADSRESPRAVYSGRPVFGDDVPTARLYGRGITNLLTWVETGTRAIEDAMCGFRVYPLASVLPLCESIGTRLGMEFDTEILVKVVRAGLPLRFFPTRVRYPQGGRSHYRMIGDNLRLSRMHAVLLSQRLRQVAARTRPQARSQ